MIKYLTKEIIEASYQSLDKIQSTIKVWQWLAMSHDFKYRASYHLKIHFIMVKKIPMEIMNKLVGDIHTNTHIDK